MSAGQDALSGAASGATIGSVVPGLGTVAGGLIGGAIGLAPSLFKLFKGNSQSNQANNINPVNPGYQVNQNVIDNANILRNRYGNYTLPGYSQAKDNINRGYQDAFSKGVQGATSGGDVSDLAAKLAYGKNIAENQLETQNAQGKDAALGQYLDASTAAGQQYQNKNLYDQQQYQDQLKEKAALTQAGATNTYNALDTGASVLSSYLNPRHTVTDFSNTNSGKTKKLNSIFDTPVNTDVSNVDYNQIFQRYPAIA